MARREEEQRHHLVRPVSGRPRRVDSCSSTKGRIVEVNAEAAAPSGRWVSAESARRGTVNTFDTRSAVAVAQPAPEWYAGVGAARFCAAESGSGRSSRSRSRFVGAGRSRSFASELDRGRDRPSEAVCQIVGRMSSAPGAGEGQLLAEVDVRFCCWGDGVGKERFARVSRVRCAARNGRSSR